MTGTFPSVSRPTAQPAKRQNRADEQKSRYGNLNSFAQIAIPFRSFSGESLRVIEIPCCFAGLRAPIQAELVCFAGSGAARSAGTRYRSASALIQRSLHFGRLR